jgi:hypothetical protein
MKGHPVTPHGWWRHRTWTACGQLELNPLYIRRTASSPTPASSRGTPAMSFALGAPRRPGATHTTESPSRALTCLKGFASRANVAVECRLLVDVARIVNSVNCLLTTARRQRESVSPRYHIQQRGDFFFGRLTKGMLGQRECGLRGSCGVRRQSQPRRRSTPAGRGRGTPRGAFGARSPNLRRGGSNSVSAADASSDG